LTPFVFFRYHRRILLLRWFKLKKLLFIVSFCVILAAAIFIPLSLMQEDKTTSNSKTTKTPEDTKLTIAAFGDTMLHMPQINSGLQPDGSYRFDSFFKEVKPYLSQADLTIGNLETTLAGKQKPYSGFPLFNSPDEIVDALKNAGVDLMSTANNHSIDTGPAGVKRTYNQLKKKQLLPVGTAPRPEEQKPTIVEKNKIKVAFLAYTEQTNGNPVPQDQPYLVNRINQTQIKQDIAEAKKQGAEFVVVSLHFGVEYQRQPNEKQKQIAHQVLKDGADVILGSHPHVLQKMERVKEGNKNKFIIYSMGNFVSNQSDPHTDEGIIVYLDLKKNFKTKQVKLEKISYLPTFVHKYQKNGKRNYAVIPQTSSEPKVLSYPGHSKSKWIKAWKNTTTLMNQQESFPTFSPQEP
jgi:poly-gamma-glutamate synthesis protein (capsule biosynthesis protein)